MCSAERASVLTHGPDYEYRTLPDRSFTMWRCDACGHGYLDPLPAPEELRDIYPATYYTVNPRSPIHFPERLYEIKMRRDVAASCR